MTVIRSVPGRMVDEFMFHGFADTEGNLRGPHASLEHGFIPDPPPRFWIRFVFRYCLSNPADHAYVGCEATTSGGPWKDRGEAEEVAAWLNRRAGLRVFFYATKRSPLEP